MHYHFSAKLKPEGVKPIEAQAQPLDIEISELTGMRAKLSLLIGGGTYPAIIVTTPNQVKDYFELVYRVSEACKGVFDAVTFLKGECYGIELLSLLKLRQGSFGTSVTA